MKKILTLLILIILITCSKESGSDTIVSVVDATPVVANSSDTSANNDADSTTETNTSDTSSDSESASFDRKAMLENWVNNIIIPLNEDFKTKLYSLKEETSNFRTSPNSENLKLVKEKWLIAYKSWQHIEMFDYGKAEEIYYQSKMNVYPTDSERVERNISSETYNLDNANNNDAQGFPAIDYMLYGIADTEEKIIEKFSQSDNKYISYLTNVIDKMYSVTSEVSNYWTNNKDSFISSTENTATSSINKVTNDFIFYYEKGFRANKIGIPAGVFSGTTLPDRVEGYYSKIYSKELALEALAAVENFFSGKKFNSDIKGEGLETYLNFLKSDGTDLSKSISDQFVIAKEKISGLNEDFTTQISSDNNKMLVTYDEIQKGVVFLKTDMLQTLSISVDYVDADGD